MPSVQDFTAYYHPIVQARTGATVGVEVLARVMHLGRWLPPQDSRLPASPAGWLTVDLAALWTALRLDARARHSCPPYVFVNVSARVLSTPEHFSSYLEYVADTTIRLQHSTLVVEIDEHWVADTAELRSAVARLHRAGALVAMDDHRGETEDIAREQDIPWQFIKIDASRRHLGCPLETLRGMIQRFSSANDSRPIIVIECVEDLAEVHGFLAQYPEVLIQGYCYSRPPPFKDSSRSVPPKGTEPCLTPANKPPSTLRGIPLSPQGLALAKPAYSPTAPPSFFGRTPPGGSAP